MQQFVAWRADPNPCGLWVSGAPGVGKTILSSLVIDELFNQEIERGAGVAYYYFDYARKEAHTADHFLRSILRQLCALRTPLPKAALEFHRAYSIRPVFAGILAATLSQVIQNFSNVYVVIDALDEFDQGPDRQELLDYLTTLAQNSLKVLVTSRPHSNEIRTRLAKFKTLQVEANTDDIRVFLSETIDKDLDAQEIMEDDKGLREEIIDTLMGRAKGM